MPYVPQNKDVFVDIELFKKGLRVQEDTTSAPVGSFRIMKNVQLTERGGIAPRPGVSILGERDTNPDNRCHGFYNFVRSFASDELLLKNVGDQTLAYSLKNPNLGWFEVRKNKFADREWGYTTALVNQENQDYVIGGNRYDPFTYWTGDFVVTDGATAIGSTTLIIGSSLSNEILDTGTVDTATTTTVTINSDEWATDMWSDLYIEFATGDVRKIVSNTLNTLTFVALGTAPANGTTFVIKQAVIAEGQLISWGGEDRLVQSIDTNTSITLASGFTTAIPAGTGVTTAWTNKPLNPRGNRFTNYLARVISGNVRLATALDNGGTQQGYTAGASAFVSTAADPINFNYSAARIAGEGDIISTPYGGGDITDVNHFEDQFYIFKKNYIEACEYSQDSLDVVKREPLKERIGSIGKTISGSDEVYFVTADNVFTSISRVADKDLKPQTSNIGYVIQRLLNQYDFRDVAGIEYKDKIYVACRSNSEELYNDLVIIYNKEHDSFEGEWNINVFGFEIWNNELYYAESSSGNTYKLFDKLADDFGDSIIPIETEVATNFYNFTSTHNNQNAANGIYVEGYTNQQSVIRFKVWKDFEDDAFLEFEFKPGDENQYLSGNIQGTFLGQNSMGLNPMGSITNDFDERGRRRFYFRLYHPFTYGRHFSMGWSSKGIDEDFELIRFGVSVSDSYNVDAGTVKT